jgi:hypothetical protein
MASPQALNLVDVGSNPTPAIRTVKYEYFGRFAVARVATYRSRAIILPNFTPPYPNGRGIRPKPDSVSVRIREGVFQK